MLWQHQHQLGPVAPPSCGEFLPALPAPASCTPTFSPNLLAALPHFITPRCGLSLIITLLIPHCQGCTRGLIWMGGRGWASRKPTHPAFDSNKVRRINRLWSETCEEKQELSTGAGRLFPRMNARERQASLRPHVEKKGAKSVNTVFVCSVGSR